MFISNPVINCGKAVLTNPRFALLDTSKKYNEGAPVGSYNNDNLDVGNSIDGNKGTDGTDHAAVPNGTVSGANFFVDLAKSSVVMSVIVWPRYRFWDHNYHYEGDIVYAGSVSCPSHSLI